MYDNLENINYEQMRATADSLRTSSNRLESIFAEVDNEMGKIGADETWKSRGATEFINKFNSLKVKFPDFVQKIKDFANYIDSTVERDISADTKIGQNANENLSS